MPTEEAFLNSLLDFSGIPSKKTELTNTNLSFASETKKLAFLEHAGSKTDRKTESSTKISENEVFGNNDKLLKAFNTLRDKLGQVNRENIGLKENLEILQKESEENKNKHTYLTNQVHSLTKKVNQYEQECSQYKLRLNMAKQTVMESDIKAEEIEKCKLLNEKLMDENKQLKEEIKISMELSLHEKLELEQEIQTLKMQQNQLAKTSEQTENALYKKNNDLVHLENEYKKLKLLYEEEIFLKTVDSESLMLKQENQELRLVNDELMTKLKKEKNKKYQLETQLLNLEEKVRLFGTKTDVYEGELETALKKIKKVEKENHENKKHANEALNEKLTWEEKFLQSAVILEELISRVKRDLIGDTVELAKTCEFRLNKLKNDEKIDFKQKLPLKREKSSSRKKLRSESKRKLSIHRENKPEEKDIEKFALLSHTEANQLMNLETQKEDFSKTVLKERLHQNVQNNHENLTDVKKKLFSDFNTSEKINFNASSSKTNEKQILPLSQISINTNPNKEINLEAKIRKEREMMERKLREKILYHKIEDTATEPGKNKLREEYLNINFDF